ncbi:endonuclease I family protein [Bacillus thuringiensis]|uniref:endonuclease I family protein n=1 Tax=Bacillus thuringiensis TaxID=1428 RepID=UPI000BFCF1C6|nr:endonuclease [Bacillus thuringiensis]PGU16084.1 ribonuclease [Bacillus thuringiensis]PGX96365.1 ribonuclease [Bacillus thuringiensis]
MNQLKEVISKAKILLVISLILLSGCRMNGTTQPDVSQEKVSDKGNSIRNIQLSHENEGNIRTERILGSDYYNNVNDQSGEELKRVLHEIIKKQDVLSYAQTKQALKETDEDPNNPNNLLLFYTGRSQSKQSFGSSGDLWNREHVWSKAHGGFNTEKGPATDLHHLRPEDASVNADRGNLDFDLDDGHVNNPNAICSGKKNKEAPDTCYDDDSWEPRDEIKGDVARIMFYMAVRYEGESGERDLELVDRTGTKVPNHGKLSTLLKWHEQDPVDELERRRNNIIYEKYQHNRNPFIDHPEYVGRIWD